MRSFLLPILLLAAASCASSGVEGLEFGDPPNRLGGFPPQTFKGIIHASASFGEHEHDLGIDMLDEVGLIPIKITVLLRGQDQDTAQIQAIDTSMNLRLFLPDGTCLRSMTVDQAVDDLDEDDAKVVRRMAFRGNLLGVEPIEGYVFFSLAPESSFAIDGSSVRHLEKGMVRTMNIGNSLLSFELEVNNLSQPFFVGLQR